MWKVSFIFKITQTMKMKKKKKPKELEWEIKIIEKMILNIDLLKGVTVIHYKYQAYTRYKS